MKVCVVQPAYSLDFSKSDELFRWEMETLDKCDSSMDLIVFPEYSNVPSLAATKEQMESSYEKYNKPLMEKAAETAKRCSATVFINGMYKTPTGLRNTTVAFGKDGREAGCYFKQHLVPSEMYTYELDKDYTWEYSAPTILEIDGIRYGFLICYDFYFYELFSNIARFNPDMIIACAYQRSDTHDTLEMMSKFCAYNCNAYVVRSSVSLGADSLVGGSSMIVAPDGTVLADMKNEVGFKTAELDPHKRHLKPAGFGNPPAPHHNYIEAGRRPWKYRAGGSAIVRYDGIMNYPRICAHRGFNTVAPENSMPAFGAAIALGAQEIEFDLWPTKDGQIVSCHDRNLERVSNGTGLVTDHTLEELKQLDFGIKFSEAYRGLSIVTFEEILQKYAGHVIMNIHVKPLSFTEDYPKESMKKIVALIKEYDCEKHVYFMLESDRQIEQFKEYAPEIPICVGHLFDRPTVIVDRAIKYGCEKVQLFKPYFNQEMIDKAHENGIICNVFWSDDPEEAREFLNMGIDVILTNDYQRIADALKI